MKRAISLLFVGFLPLFALSYPPVPKNAGESLKEWGEYIDPDKDCKAEVEKGVLMLTLPQTYHDLTYQVGNKAKLNSPRLMKDVKGDFTLSVSVNDFPIPNNSSQSTNQTYTFQAAGLVIWKDEKNFIRFERGGDGDADPFVRFEIFSGGKSISDGEKPWKHPKTYLQIARQKDKWLFQVSADGKDWEKCNEANLDWANPLKAGVHAINTVKGDFSAKFENLKLDEPK